MTRETAKQLWPIIKAWAEGETLQFRNAYGEFNDIDDVVFNEDASCYRIKPKPRTFWANTYPPQYAPIIGTLYASKEEAEKHALSTRLECIRVVEAL